MAKLICGSSVRSFSASVSGTAGCLVRFPDMPEKLLLLTAGHILVGSATKQFDAVTSDDLPGCVLGGLLSWTGLDGTTTTDAALVHIDPTLMTADIGELGPPAGINRNPAVDDELTIVVGGKTHTLQIREIGADIPVTNTGPGFRQTLLYRNQILASGLAVDGCDGALALDKDRKVVGMVIGVEETAGTVITPVGALLEHPDWGNGPPLEICTSVPPVAEPPEVINFPNRAPTPKIRSASVPTEPLVGTPGTATPPPEPGDFVTLLRRAMDDLGMASRSLRAGTAAICFGESGFRPRREDSYAHTSAARIRMIFGRRVQQMTDAQIDALKVNDEAFFNLVYGGEFGRTQLGNTEPGDGFRFIGRGPIQLTGRGNYTKYGFLIGVDLTRQPDMVNEPETGCKVAVAYMKDRYHGGGFEAMKRAVGNVVATTEGVKNAAFDKFQASGLFGGTEA